ncbi:unnamed protein product [Sympodiomycopsis kandeliae]
MPNPCLAQKRAVDSSSSSVTIPYRFAPFSHHSIPPCTLAMAEKIKSIATSETASSPISSGTGWLRLSAHLKTRRPSPRVLIIAISNPPYNLLDGDILSELKRVLLALSPVATGAVILTSAIDDIFISHYSVDEIVNFSKLVPFPIPTPVIRGLIGFESWAAWAGFRGLTRRTPLAPLSHLNLYHEVTNLLRTIPQVTIAAINGRAFGGGCELALACDFRIMVDTSPEGAPGVRGSGIGQPEITLGLLPGGGGTQMLNRIVGPAKALDLCLTGRLISANEALELGIVNAVVPRNKLLNECGQLAKQLSKRNPVAVAAVKDAIHNGGTLPIAQGMRREQGSFGRTALSAETVNAMKTYLKHIDGLLGPKSSLDNFQPLLDGTFVDMSPGGASRERKNKLA